MQLRRRVQLLSKVGGGVDQEPVCAVGTEGNGGLGSLKLAEISPRCPAAGAAAVPLRDPAAGGGAQDDDAKHESVSWKHVSRWISDQRNSPHSGNASRPKDPPALNAKPSPLLAGGAHIHVDFHAARHFDDLRCFPG